MSETRQELALKSTQARSQLTVAGELDEDDELEVGAYSIDGIVWLRRDDVIKLRDHLSAVLGDGGGHRC